MNCAKTLTCLAQRNSQARIPSIGREWETIAFFTKLSQAFYSSLELNIAVESIARLPLPPRI